MFCNLTLVNIKFLKVKHNCLNSSQRYCASLSFPSFKNVTQKTSCSSVVEYTTLEKWFFKMWNRNVWTPKDKSMNYFGNDHNKCLIKMIFFEKSRNSYLKSLSHVPLSPGGNYSRTVYLHEHMTSTMAPRSMRLTGGGICWLSTDLPSSTVPFRHR